MESQLDCLKSLFGDVDSGKIYEICQGSCLCDALSANENLSDSTAAVFF